MTSVGKRWTKEEVEVLVKMAEEGCTLDTIASTMLRSPETLTRMLRPLGFAVLSNGVLGPEPYALKKCKNQGNTRRTLKEGEQADGILEEYWPDVWMRELDGTVIHSREQVRKQGLQ